MSFRPNRFRSPISPARAGLSATAIFLTLFGAEVLAETKPAQEAKDPAPTEKAALVPTEKAAPALTEKTAPAPTEKTDAKTRASYVADLCQRIEAAAQERKLPPAFFARLIWTESRFDPNAVSPKGAAGVAQFMPATARERGLEDPFDHKTAVPASAHYLADLHAQFGNLGLAAAAYNAGPNRVQSWRDGRSGLPIETQNFVLTITGVSAHLWKDAKAPKADFTLDKTVSFLEGCRQMPTRRFRKKPSFTYASTNWHPWNVSLTAGWSRTRALARYKTMQREFPKMLAGIAPMVLRDARTARGKALRFKVGVGKPTRAEAMALCQKLRGAGGVCLVQKSR